MSVHGRVCVGYTADFGSVVFYLRLDLISDIYVYAHSDPVEVDDLGHASNAASYAIFFMICYS